MAGVSLIFAAISFVVSLWALRYCRRGALEAEARALEAQACLADARRERLAAEARLADVRLKYGAVLASSEPLKQ